MHLSVGSEEVVDIDFENIFRIGIRILNKLNISKDMYQDEESYKLEFHKYLQKLKKNQRTACCIDKLIYT